MPLTTQQMLDECREAHHLVVTGRQVVEAWDGDFRARYNVAKLDDLKERIRELEGALAAEAGTCVPSRRPLGLIL